MKDIVLTGDRPTGKLHLGHYIGSLKNRVELQHKYDTSYVMIADLQALTDHTDESQKVRDSVLEVAYDYLSVGIDPSLNTIFIQSLIPELTEFAFLYMNFVTLARLKRNPTVKAEMKQKNYSDAVPTGFLVYPISQAADITAFNATLIPVGEDQLPMIEQTNEIVRQVNHRFNTELLVECKALLSHVSRLPGTDGSAKMGKSLGNCIYLSDDKETLTKKIMSMFTDPNHIHVNDPGNVEVNTVFKYLDAFDPNQEELEGLKEHYTRGGLGDVVLKRRLNEILEAELAPIREKRKIFSQDPGQVMKMLKDGSEVARAVAAENLTKFKKLFNLDY